MANRTVKYATSVHGTNPQYLIEKIVRERIYDSKYWQEDCFLLTSALVLERAVDDLKYVGGTYGAKIDPTPFMCLVLKLLQIQPQKEIVYLFIEQPDFKYLRALGAFYLRLTGKPVEIYTKLEPLYNDYRKLRLMDTQRKFNVIHMDEFIDELLREEKLLNISLPRITKRIVLESNHDIEPYKSELEEQNLIPTQLIEEKIERQKIERDRDRDRDRDKSSSHRHYHEREITSSRHHQTHSPSSSASRYRRDDHRRHCQDHSSSSRDYSSHRHRDYEPQDRRRSRSKSPRELERNAPTSSRVSASSKYTSGRGRFSEEEIKNENAIRASVGLKPLR